MAGIIGGFAALLLAVAAGLGSIFQLWPPSHSILKVVGTAYLFYLAWRIANAETDSNSDNKSAHPFTAAQAAGFQFVNPKAWIMCITAISTFTREGEQYAFSAALIVIVYSLVMLNTLPVWTLFGKLIARKLKTHQARTRFNYIMGALTASSVFMIIY